MRKGDEITIPVIVHNYLDNGEADTASLEVQGLIRWRDSQQMTVPSKGDGVAVSGA